jgi:hypothetical protein
MKCDARRPERFSWYYGGQKILAVTIFDIHVKCK